MPNDPNIWTLIVSTLLGGGFLGALINQFFLPAKTHAEAMKTKSGGGKGQSGKGKNPQRDKADHIADREDITQTAMTGAGSIALIVGIYEVDRHEKSTFDTVSANLGSLANASNFSVIRSVFSTVNS